MTRAATIDYQGRRGSILATVPFKGHSYFAIIFEGLDEPILVKAGDVKIISTEQLMKEYGHDPKVVPMGYRTYDGNVKKAEASSKKVGKVDKAVAGLDLSSIQIKL